MFYLNGIALWAVELFPFRRDTLAWAGLRGGKALGVTKPAFPLSGHVAVLRCGMG